MKSPRLMYLTGVGVGETTLFAVDDNDNVLMSTRIRVTHNIEALQQGIRSVAPGQKVSAATVDQSLVLTGTVENAERGGERAAGGEPVRRRPDAGGEPDERRGADPGEPAGPHRRGVAQHRPPAGHPVERPRASARRAKIGFLGGGSATARRRLLVGVRGDRGSF